MAGRLEGKAAVVVGAGQTPGETIGNGRAMAMLFAREGARVVCVDRVGERAEETVALIKEEGGEKTWLAADIVSKGARLWQKRSSRHRRRGWVGSTS